MAKAADMGALPHSNNPEGAARLTGRTRPPGRRPKPLKAFGFAEGVLGGAAPGD